MDSNSQVGTIFQTLQTKEAPPTYFKTNKVTSSFQEIVDAYGLVIAGLFTYYSPDFSLFIPLFLLLHVFSNPCFNDFTSPLFPLISHLSPSKLPFLSTFPKLFHKLLLSALCNPPFPLFSFSFTPLSLLYPSLPTFSHSPHFPPWNQSWEVPRGQPCSVFHCDFPLPLCRHVWGLGPRNHDASGCSLPCQE